MSLAIDPENAFTKKKQHLHAYLINKLDQLQRKEKGLQANLERCRQWKTLYHEGELIKAHLSALQKEGDALIVWDWETERSIHLILEPRQTPQDAMVIRFKTAKRLERGIQVIQQQMDDVYARQERLEQLLKELESVQNTQDLEAINLPPSVQKSVSDSSSPGSPIYREYYAADGTKIWVGKSAKANDKLTFQLANGRDWWLHVSGFSGSHVVIRLEKEQEPNRETVEDAMQLALYHSKARDQGEGEVCVTQRKYVLRAGKGQPGKVHVSKHKNRRVRFSPERYQAIKSRG